MPASVKAEIEQGVNRIIGANKFEIVLTSGIIDDCIKRQYDWYAEIIKREKRNVNNFFDQLAGEEAVMKNYKTIFEGIESTLISRSTLGADELRERLEKFKHLEGRTFSDDEYYWILVYVVFYSGFRAATVTARLDVIRKYFTDFRIVADYTESDIEQIMGDPNMIKNGRKVRACVENARTLRNLVGEHGSFQKYIESFAPTESFENLMLLKEELAFRFSGLGNIAPYHFLTDIGMRVLKPDRVVCRIFQRLGLIESEQQLLKTVIQGRKFADATGHPIRYIDIVFAAYGQEKSEDLGIGKGICLTENPQCSICGARSYCRYPQ